MDQASPWNRRDPPHKWILSTLGLLVLVLVGNNSCTASFETSDEDLANIQVFPATLPEANQSSGPETLDLVISFRGEEVMLRINHVPLLPVTSSEGRAVVQDEQADVFEAGVYTNFVRGAVMTVRRSDEGDFTVAGLFYLKGEEWFIDSKSDFGFSYRVRPGDSMRQVESLFGDGLIRDVADPEIFSLEQRSAFFEQQKDEVNNWKTGPTNPSSSDVGDTISGGSKTDESEKSQNQTQDDAGDSPKVSDIEAGDAGRSRRRRRAVSQRYLVELGFTVDNADYQKWKDTVKPTTKALTYLRLYYTYVAEMINFRFQTLYDPGFAIATTVLYLRVHLSLSDDGWVIVEEGTLDVRDGLERFALWVADPSHNYPLADHHMWFSGYEMPASVQGLAYVGKLCTTGSVSLVANQFSEMTHAVAARELRQSLSSINSLSCPEESPFVPGRGDVLVGPEDEFSSRLWLSGCSVDALKDYLNTVSCAARDGHGETDPGDQCQEVVIDPATVNCPRCEASLCVESQVVATTAAATTATTTIPTITTAMVATAAQTAALATTAAATTILTTTPTSTPTTTTTTTPTTTSTTTTTTTTTPTTTTTTPTTTTTTPTTSTTSMTTPSTSNPEIMPTTQNPFFHFSWRGFFPPFLNPRFPFGSIPRGPGAFLCQQRFRQHRDVARFLRCLRNCGSNASPRRFPTGPIVRRPFPLRPLFPRRPSLLRPTLSRRRFFLNRFPRTRTIRRRPSLLGRFPFTIRRTRTPPFRARFGRNHYRRRTRGGIRRRSRRSTDGYNYGYRGYSSNAYSGYGSQTFSYYPQGSGTAYGTGFGYGYYGRYKRSTGSVYGTGASNYRYGGGVYSRYPYGRRYFSRGYGTRYRPGYFYG
ncbi:hypothetical protein PoB_005554000 [Plakobranchus ocellatus]|uniref:Uncharacterized protein n=1 Tax=Plakobranchus ocellatus TaxID=259542 RepID=A0AAV4C8J1_9GAST|nr:hypothetical protein PoB_005554000 [Plakobranchus ocellatus]